MDKEKEEQPSFYAVIPATVRYDKNVPAGAKLLYAEITSLCNKKGYCWAGNAYFADLYQTSERTVINWINTLKKYGYIIVSFVYVPGKKEIQSRIIKLPPSFEKIKSKKESAAEKDLNESGKENASENDSNEGEVVKISSPRGENIFTTYGKFFHEVVKNPSKGGEKNFMDNTTSNIKTTTTAEEQPYFIPDKPPDGETAAAEALSPEKIKKAMLELDRSLLLKVDFYPRAAAFMSLHHLDKSYLSWLYKQVELREPRDFDGLFFTLFFAENMLEKYKISKQTLKTPPPVLVICPVCGASHDKQADKCPQCSLPKDPSSGQIDLYRDLISLPPDKRDEYLRKYDDIYASCGAFNKQKRESLLDDLKKDYFPEFAHEEPSRSYYS